MDLPIYGAIIAIILLGIVTIFLSIRDDKSHKLLKEREQKQKQKLYQLQILKEIQDRIGYSLDIEKVIGVIAGSLKNLFPYSTASSLLIREDKLVFKTYVEESISHIFIEQVKKNMVASLTLLAERILPTQIDERVSGFVLDDSNKKALQSYFHIPLIVNNIVVGEITVASTEPNYFKGEDIELLFEVVNSALNALSRLENVLHTEEGKIMAMIGSLADGVFMVDMDRKLSIINNSAKSLLKITKPNPTIIDVLSSVPISYDLSGKIDSAISEKKSIIEKEVKLGDRFIQVFITPVFNPQLSGTKDETSVIGASVLLHDITLEKSLANMKEDFTNMMVHELRSPLTAIKGASDVLAKENTVNETQKSLLEIINNQSKNLLEQVNTILDAAKLDSGKFILDKKQGDLEKLIDQHIQIFLPQAQSKHVTLEHHMINSLPLFSFDSIRIGQVINNLISNSIKFTPAGGTITVSGHYVDSIEHPYVEIQIRDTGIGIPENKKINLFKKYSPSTVGTLVTHEGSAEQTQSQSGTGLGLYITKGIVEAHGGTITATSDGQHGTTMTFTIPVTFGIRDDHSANFTPHPIANLRIN